MCIIIVNKKGILSKDTIYNCWESNPDGAGIMYTDQGKIITIKELKKKKAIYNQYINIRKHHKGVIILHFRIGTSGKKDYVNCHPFIVNDQLSFCHNGIINDTTIAGSEYSDTFIFNEQYLKRLPYNFLQDEVICKLLSKFVSGSKLAFLDHAGRYQIINEQAGHWDVTGDNWYSNYSYYIDDKYNYNYYPVNHVDYWHESNKKHEPFFSEICDNCGKVLLSDFEVKNYLCDKCYHYFYEDDYAIAPF